MYPEFRAAEVVLPERIVCIDCGDVIPDGDAYDQVSIGPDHAPAEYGFMCSACLNTPPSPGRENFHADA